MTPQGTQQQRMQRRGYWQSFNDLRCINVSTQACGETPNGAATDHMQPRSAAALWGFEIDLNALLDDFAVQVRPGGRVSD